MSQQIDFDPSVDYYKALGVSDQASADEIKRAYRKLAKQFHPDSTGGDKAKEARFKEVSNAYDVLGDAKKRGLYDQLRSGGPFGGGPGGGHTYTTRGGGPGVFDLSELFGQFFAGAAAARGRGGSVEFEDAGRAGRERRAPEPAPRTTAKASDGTTLRVEGADVHSDLRVPFDHAILGTVATIATLDGKAEVKVPPGTSSGKKLRLRGKGVTERGGRAGDHYVTIQIDVPRELDDAEQKLLVQLTTRLRKRGHHG